MRQEEFHLKQIMTGFKTVVLGICLFIVELLSLPIFGYLQKLQVSGDGFYSDFIRYAGEQPYPTIFFFTGVIVIAGIAFMLLGYRGRKQGD